LFEQMVMFAEYCLTSPTPQLMDMSPIKRPI
jgi:hypothetical protein